MATQIPSKFTKYDLSELELKLAAVGIDDLAAMWIQTLIANAAEEKIALKVDTTNIHDFVQQEAYLQGQIDALQVLIDARLSLKD